VHHSSSQSILLGLTLTLLVACEATSTPATLEPATNFPSGVSGVAQGEYLFAEIDRDRTCSDASHCPCWENQPPEPAYSYSSSTLRLFKLDDKTLDTNWTVQDLPSSTIGFWGDGSFSNHLYTITNLPYVSSGGQVVIYGVDAQGQIAARVSGGTYVFKPGQSWAESTNLQLDLPEGCYYVDTYRVINHGLLTRQQIANGSQR
jgi:hypothetical protein